MCVNSSYPNFGQSKMQTEDLTVFPSDTCNMSSYNLSSVTQSHFREHLSRSFAPLWIIPCPFPRTFCFWQSGYCVRFLIKRPQSYSLLTSCARCQYLNNYHAQYSRNNLQLCTWFVHDMFLTDVLIFFDKNADRDQNCSFDLVYFQRSGVYTHWLTGKNGTVVV